MLKPGQNRPSTPNNSKGQAGYSDALPHWRQGVRETVLSTATDGTLNFSIEGGSDNGEFAYLTDVIQNKVNYASGRLEDGDIVLEIQGQKVAGYTQRDVVAWLHHCCRNGNPVVLKTVSVGGITKDLRQFLNTRFQKGSVDHELQNTIRDNLYLRTVPVTTRVPREGEVNGVDYTFLSPDEFLALEHSGNLLESGLYEGHHYGTPKPSKEPTVGPPQSPGSAGNLNLLIGGIFPGAHPSSEGKRKRNRSNVEAMAAKSMDPEPSVGGGTMMVSEGAMSNNIEPSPPVPGSPPSYTHTSECPESPRSDLGSLPLNWEKAYTERGEVYFIDHNSGTSHWLDPRLSKFQKKSLEECKDDELPFGWEKINDRDYGTYYIDHGKKKTQYENPVIQAKRTLQGSGAATVLNEIENQDYLPAFRKPLSLPLPTRADRANMSSSSNVGKRLKMYLTCTPCLTPEGIDVLQVHHTYVKPKGNEKAAAQPTPHASPGATLSNPISQPSLQTSQISLNNRSLPKLECNSPTNHNANNPPTYYNLNEPVSESMKSKVKPGATLSSPVSQPSFHPLKVTLNNRILPKLECNSPSNHVMNNPTYYNMDKPIIKSKLKPGATLPNPSSQSAMGSSDITVPKLECNDQSNLAMNHPIYHNLNKPVNGLVKSKSKLPNSSSQIAMGSSDGTVNSTSAPKLECINQSNHAMNNPIYYNVNKPANGLVKSKLKPVATLPNSSSQIAISSSEIAVNNTSVPKLEYNNQSIHMMNNNPTYYNVKKIVTRLMKSKLVVASPSNPVSPIEVCEPTLNQTAIPSSSSNTEINLNFKLHSTSMKESLNPLNTSINPTCYVKEPLTGIMKSKLKPRKTEGHERPFFTRNPNELQGERILSSLVKSARGLGFTIIGGDDSEEEFLQIKSVVPHAPAWLEGKLQTGDTLVFVNSTCVLGFTHHDMVSMFQSIAPGEAVHLEVCRGYPLPFDPNDPNTEVVTTVAVNAPDSASSNVYVDRDGNEAYFDMNASRLLNCSEDMVNSSVKSMPDLCSSEKIKNLRRPNSTDILLNNSSDNVLGIGADFSECNLSKPEFLSISIVKGAMGFGFTIADSCYGQKVKKILDRLRCKNLMEGDILVDINNINVRNMSHGDVVQVLKDCQSNQEAGVTVQRGGLASPGKNKLGRKEEPASPRKTMYKDSILGLYRSKTPTADLYSTQQKEVVPNRPKTPLVDTRNRPRTPTSITSQQTWQQDNSGNKVNVGDGSLNKVAGPQSPGSPSSVYDPYKDGFSYGYARQDQQSPLGQLSNQLMSASISEGQPTTRPDFARSRSPGQELDYADNIPHSPGNFQQGDAGRPDNRSPSGDYCGQYASQPFFNGYGGPYDGGYSYCETLPKEYFHPAPGLPPGSIPPSSSGYYTSDSLGRRKESTSFEHEQPHPSTVTRLNRDLRWFVMGPTARVYPAGPGMEWVETIATLFRQQTGFGFRIVGGTEECSQVGPTVSIGHIVPGGAADLDGRLCTGDEIVSVDSQNVLSSSHHHVVELMGNGASNGRVTLGIRRRVPTHELQNYTKPDMGYPFDVTVSRRENEGFGFVIISSVNKAGSTIGRIIEGSPAERCGQLHVGDRILAVNHMDIINLHHGDIVNLIKDSGYTVTLTIGPPIDDTSSTASASQREEDGIEEYHAVELSRGNRGFGFSIRGGREFQNMPLFVLQIAENGPASVDNRLRVSDQIIEINGINTKNMTHAEAIEIIRNGGPCVRLLVKRGGKVPAYIAEASGSIGMGMRPSSSLSQPSCAPTTTPSTLNGPMCWDRFPPS